MSVTVTLTFDTQEQAAAFLLARALTPTTTQAKAETAPAKAETAPAKAETAPAKAETAKGESATALTFNDVKGPFLALASKGGVEAQLALLGRFGLQKLSSATVEQYPAILAAIEEVAA